VAAAHFKAEDGGVNHFEAKNGYGREVSKSMSLLCWIATRVR